MSFFQSPFNPVNVPTAENTVRNISSIDPKLSRTNYYDGRLLKASDLIRDQFYLDERLREAGRVLGQGIVRGLDIELSPDNMLSIKPGLAVAPSGRILELEKDTLKINLEAMADIAAFNPGFRYLERGLYAIVLEYAEKGEGSAEVYPRDLESERGFHFNAYAEGVVVTLKALHTPYVHSAKGEINRLNGSVFSRAALVRHFIMANRNQLPEIPENGVALGLLAVENGSPVWCDYGLLRRQHRPLQERYSLQMDLYYHYEELLHDVLRLRQESTRETSFPADHYFDVLPPFGSVPKHCIDPTNGYQGYFPQGFDVSIAPVRIDDINAIVEQSKALEPIDLQRDTDVDIIVLVPLSDIEFAKRARQLQQTVLLPDSEGGGKAFVHPPRINDFSLRVYGKRDIHEENTDSTIWADIWAGAKNIFYVRRPTRVAETQVSAIVLATGDYEDLVSEEFSLPDTEEMAERIEDLEARIEELEEQLNEATQSPDERLEEAAAIIDDLEDDIDTLENERDSLIEARDALKVERDKLKDERDRLSAELEAALKDDGQAGALQEQIKQLREENERLSRELKAAQERINELEKGYRRWLSIEEILDIRPVEDARIRMAIHELHEKYGQDEEFLSLIQRLMQLMPTRYDPLNWRTIITALENNQLGNLVKAIEANNNESFAKQMVSVITRLKLGETLIRQWQKLADAE